MAEQTGGRISQGLADSATLAGRACFVTILWKISGSAWLELEVSKKMDGRTITGMITKRYPKVARRCLGPPLAQLLAFEALFYNAYMLACCHYLSETCYVAVPVRALLARTRLSQSKLPLRNLLRSHCTAGTICLSLHIKSCMLDLRRLADRDWRLRKSKQTRI